jgi:hypothetical protein
VWNVGWTENLNRIRRIALLPDTPAIRRMLAKVSHLVRVIETKEIKRQLASTS